MTESKALLGVELKDEAKGLVSVKFAAYNEVDHHNDVTLKGAFKDGQRVLVSAYNHGSWGGSLPVGKGVIRDGGEYAKADLQFFLNTTAGRETFETVKSTGELQQWSYGFDIEEADPDGEFEGKSVRILKKLDVHEISPVLMGAGKSTQTLSVKSAESTEKRGTLRMSDQCVEVVASVKALADRAEEIVALRKADGKKGLAPETALLLDVVADQLSRIKRLADAHSEPVELPKDDTLDEALIAQTLINLSDL